MPPEPATAIRDANPQIFRSAKSDIPAGFVVFLVALPLCLGIALASNAPLASGLLTGIIAGLVVSWLSGSQLSVSGPAAGLTVTVTTAIATLGSYEAVLVAIFIAGVAQIVFGLCRMGVLASFFPHSVIKGMLAAIGIIIILKQIPHAIGWDSDFEGDESFIQSADQENTFSEIANAVERMHVGATIISLVAFAILILWGRNFIKRHKILSMVPGPLLAVAVGLLLNELFKIHFPQFALLAGEGHLVQLPKGGARGFLAELPHPQWVMLKEAVTWKVAATIAIIASIESLLSVEATDKIDPDRRTSNTNRELIAQGTGNVLCGMFGGLPLTAVIVRSTANVYAGGRTWLSSFTHGLFLLAAVIFLSGSLNKIPLAALAAVLIHVGIKLASWDTIKTALAEGCEQALPFFVTIVAVVTTDLLTGVSIGLVVGLIIVVRMNHHSALTQVSDGKDILIRFAKDVTFFHKPALKEMFMAIPDGSSVTIDGTRAQFIDHDILDAVRDFMEGSSHRTIRVELRNMRSKRLSVKGVRDGKLQEPVTS